MKKRKIKKLKLKKDIKIIVLYLLLFPIITKLFYFKTLELFLIDVVCYTVNLLYIIAIINDKKIIKTIDKSIIK